MTHYTANIPDKFIIETKNLNKTFPKEMHILASCPKNFVSQKNKHGWLEILDCESFIMAKNVKCVIRILLRINKCRTQSEEMLGKLDAKLGIKTLP